MPGIRASRGKLYIEARNANVRKRGPVGHRLQIGASEGTHYKCAPAGACWLTGRQPEWAQIYMLFKLFTYSSGVRTEISSALKSLPFLVIKTLQSVSTAQ